MLLSASLLALVTLAFADDDAPSEPSDLPEDTAEEPSPPTESAPTTAFEEEPAPVRKRNFLMEVGFRGRYMDLPDAIVDLFSVRNEGGGIMERPHVSAYSLGLEFVVTDKKDNGIFYVEYLRPIIEEGYWDDLDEYSDDGKWIKPEDFGLVLIGATYAKEVRATDWLSFLFGAGIGAGIKVGQLTQWEAGEDPADPKGDNNNSDVSCGTAPTPAYVRKENGCESDGYVETPPILPYLDIMIGPKFNISDRASIRLEGGIHAFLPYGGGSVGIMF